ncbi:MAG TPA: peptidylprolyl isomerase [Polyangiaceae bacterium]|nr:peptidylprolyl isomerase [Polyangiaceae bacterium]
MPRSDGATPTKLARLLREPTLHFFALAALLLSVQRLVTGDPRTIVVTPALEADLLRHYQDQIGRAPTSAEASAFMGAWKTDEVLYREALREGLDREDPTVRSVLVAKMRERALLQSRVPEPSDAELGRYFEEHRAQFETPLIYEHEYVAFPKSDADAERERAKVEAELAAGASPASLKLRTTGANVDRTRIEQEFGPSVADAICRLPLGQWRELETNDRLLLVQMIAVRGGLPPPDVLHAELVAAWKGEKERAAVARATQAIAARYRFEEKSP